MKSSKFILALLGSTVISFAAFSQQDSTKPVEEKKPVTEQAQPATDAAQPAIVDHAETNLPKPNAGRHYIPVVGAYQATGDSTAIKNISVTVDEQNPGKIWIEGLEPVKIYAVLKAIPGTYKIPSQKVDDKKYPEGTLLYDESNKQINVCVGCGYSDASPAVATAEPMSTDKKSKVKKEPVLSFTGSKSETGTASK